MKYSVTFSLFDLSMVFIGF